MKLDKIKLGDITYNIELVKGLERDDEDPSERRKLDGYITFHDTRIRLEVAQNTSAMTLTLLHEIMHAMFVQSGRCADEEVIDGLSYQLYSLIKNNPKLTDFIQKGDK